MTTDQFAPRHEPVTAPIEGLTPLAAAPHGSPTSQGFPDSPSPSLGSPSRAEPVAGEWAPPSEGWAPVPANAPTGPAPSNAGRWTGRKVIAAVALTAALAGGAGFGIGMAVDSGSSSTQQGGPGGGGFGGGGGNGGPGGAGFGNQQGGTTQQDGTTQQGTVQDGSTSTT